MQKWLTISLTIVGVVLLVAGVAGWWLLAGQRMPPDGERVQIVAKDLDTPWALAFLPDGAMLITERPGHLRYIDANGRLRQDPLATIAQVTERGEGGLLGVAVHPQFNQNRQIFLYYTYQADDQATLNRVTTYKLSSDLQISDEKMLVDAIPGSINHNGGRLEFGPDGNLYITTGDAANPSLAQNRQSLAGKILRVTDTSTPIADTMNESLVYSLGHRNPQGVAWDEKGQLWETEHGQNASDEINLIAAGSNYGWPFIEGDETEAGMQAPKADSGIASTWAPSGATWYKGSLWFAGLRGQALFKATIVDDRVISVTPYFSYNFGRLREVVRGPDDWLYVLTNNRDGRGIPGEGDDKVLRIRL